MNGLSVHAAEIEPARPGIREQGCVLAFDVCGASRVEYGCGGDTTVASPLDA